MDTSSELHILYIDDDVGICRLVEKTLGKKGLRVSVAHTVEAAVDLLQQQHVDAIGLDYILPEHTGFEVFEILKKQDDCPPVIYVTGSDDINIALEALRIGASDFVIKDVQGHFLMMLDRAFRTAVDRTRLQQAKERAEQEMRETNARLEQLNATQVVMLREMNHRIGNSLQLITSMIRMQSMATQNQEVRHVLQQATERIIAVAQVHQRLYTSDDVQFVKLRPYINQILADHQIMAGVQGCKISIDVADGRIDTDRAISLGIIVSELVTNALRHAYPDAGGPINVSLADQDADTHRLIVEDDGIGLPLENNHASIGARIVDGMAKRLRSKLQIDRPERGTRFTLLIPKASSSSHPV